MIYKKRVVIVNDNDLSNDINSAQEAADSAILEQQRIYYRSKEGRIPYGAADPTDIWITNHDDRYNELSNENAATAWSTKITPIARGIDSNENEDKYLYLYTCVQKRIVSKDAVNYTLSLDTTVNASKIYYERSGMTDNYVYTIISNPSGNPHENQYYEQSPKVPHTEILLDETTTVIDGGKIITGSVMANCLNAASINAWHQLSIGAFDANTTKAISNSTYITFIDTQRGIHVHNVDDENNYVQINATDIQLVRANVPRMILGAQNLGFYGSNGSLLAEYGSITKFYESNGTLAAQLDTEGLVLKRGGIKGGEAGQNGFVYLSTEDYPRYGELINNNISNGLSINGHNPSIAQYTTSGTNDPAWREVIGTNFGVDAAGNLYAKNAVISGHINAVSLTIGGDGNSYDGIAAINISGYTIEITSDSTGVTDATTSTYLYPHLYHNGIKVEYFLSTDITVDNSKTYYIKNGTSPNYTYTVVSNPTGNPSINQYYEHIVYTDFIWYKDNQTTGTPGDANNYGRYLADYEHSYRVIYDFDDGEVGGGTAIQTREVDPSKYITQINEYGIKIHPETWTNQSSYIQLDGTGMELFNSSGNSIAKYGSTARVGLNNSSRFLMNSDSLQAYNSSNVKYFEVNANGLTWGSNVAATTAQVGVAAQTASNYITNIGNDGIRIHDIHTLNNSIIINSNGMEIFKGGTTEQYSIAKYGDVSRIGKPYVDGATNNESHLELDYHSLQLINREGDPYFHVSDLRDREGEAEITATFVSDGMGQAHSLTPNAKDTNYVVKVNNIEVTDFYLKTISDFVLTTEPPSGTLIIVTYAAATTSSEMRAFTFGKRSNNGTLGATSTVFGNECIASGPCAFALGNSNIARGKNSLVGGLRAVANGDESFSFGIETVTNAYCSAAMGLYNTTNPNAVGSFIFGCELTTQYPFQTVIGRRNKCNAQDLLEVGNGWWSGSLESNALELTYNGKLTIADILVQNSDRRLKTHINYLSNDAINFIQKLKPVYYIKDKEKHLGFYAQDIEEIDKWNCMVGEMNGYKTLSYTELIAPLVTYCQHLEERIKQLEEKYGSYNKSNN